ncbi:MAG: hypothetical protein JNG88_06765 [Phycisphaerales bacterium]|nr:hypothetical protein [Phycisphaerales bacterium]
MPRVLTDSEIAGLLSERKQLPANWTSRLAVRPKSDSTFTHREFDLNSEKGRTFRLILRGNTLNPLDFSLVLVFRDEDGTDYRLVRFNGRHPSQHTNKWEKARNLPNAYFRNQFHVHTATERYQVEGFEIDGYAEVTDRYDSFDSALDAFVRSNGLFVPEPKESSPGLFDQPADGKP